MKVLRGAVSVVIRNLLPRLAPVLVLACLALPVAAQEYMMPWERAAKEEPKVDPDAVMVIEVESGALEIVRMPVAGNGIISSHPEIAKLNVEDPNLLFIFGQAVGETHVVITDNAFQPVYSAIILVVPPRRKDG